MQMCPNCDRVYDESEYSHCPYCHPYDEDDGRERTVSYAITVYRLPCTSATCQVKCNSKLEKISEGEFQLRHLRGR